MCNLYSSSVHGGFEPHTSLLEHAPDYTLWNFKTLIINNVIANYNIFCHNFMIKCIFHYLTKLNYYFKLIIVNIIIFQFHQKNLIHFVDFVRFWTKLNLTVFFMYVRQPCSVTNRNEFYQGPMKRPYLLDVT